LLKIIYTGFPNNHERIEIVMIKVLKQKQSYEQEITGPQKADVQSKTYISNQAMKDIDSGDNICEDFFANDKFISKRGNPLFAADLSRFQVEVNLSANNIRNNIKDLLQEFTIPPSELKIYLREDRDAGI